MLHSSPKQREPVIIVILIHTTRNHFTFRQQKSVQRSFLNSDVVCFSLGRRSGGNVWWPHFIQWRFYGISPINSFIYSVTKFSFRYHVNVLWLWILLFQMLAEANDLCCFVWMCMLLMYFFVSGHLSYLLLFFSPVLIVPFKCSMVQLRMNIMNNWGTVELLVEILLGIAHFFLLDSTICHLNLPFLFTCFGKCADGGWTSSLGWRVCLNLHSFQFLVIRCWSCSFIWNDYFIESVVIYSMTTQFQLKLSIATPVVCISGLLC